MGNWRIAGLSSIPKGRVRTILVGSNEEECSDVHDPHASETGGNVRPVNRLRYQHATKRIPRGRLLI
jgi:hypothetical protein